MELRLLSFVLEMGDYTGLFRWAQYNLKGPCKWKREAGEFGVPEVYASARSPFVHK